MSLQMSRAPAMNRYVKVEDDDDEEEDEDEGDEEVAENEETVRQLVSSWFIDDIERITPLSTCNEQIFETLTDVGPTGSLVTFLGKE